jgi:SAM-dependent methyltransferase
MVLAGGTVDNSSPLNPKKRFSNRVADYVRYRPSYPPEILPFMREIAGFHVSNVVADIGSGTGLLARIFLEHGNRVFGVEPNPEMREAGEAFLAAFPRFTSVSGSAEATTLADASVDLVTAGQAFHWFDADKSRAEFARILRPGGWVVLVWNTRLESGDAFMAGYEALLEQHALDYQQVRNRGSEEERALARFFAPAAIHRAAFDNRQIFDQAGLEGRLLSSSYAPLAGQPGHGEMMVELRRLFSEHQQRGQVTFRYHTQVYAGQIG